MSTTIITLSLLAFVLVLLVAGIKIAKGRKSSTKTFCKSTSGHSSKPKTKAPSSPHPADQVFDEIAKRKNYKAIDKIIKSVKNGRPPDAKTVRGVIEHAAKAIADKKLKESMEETYKKETTKRVKVKKQEPASTIRTRQLYGVGKSHNTYESTFR